MLVVLVPKNFIPCLAQGFSIRIYEQVHNFLSPDIQQNGATPSTPLMVAEGKIFQSST